MRRARATLGWLGILAASLFTVGCGEPMYDKHEGTSLESSEAFSVQLPSDRWRVFKTEAQIKPLVHRAWTELRNAFDSSSTGSVASADSAPAAVDGVGSPLSHLVVGPMNNEFVALGVYYDSILAAGL